MSGYLTVSQLSEKTGVSPHWIYDRIRAGLLQPETRKHTRFFPDSDAIIQQVKHLRQYGSYECTSKGGHQDG
ncbi:MAG: MerR family transcriptional regulator [Alphaproteobacteria bacterium]